MSDVVRSVRIHPPLFVVGIPVAAVPLLPLSFPVRFHFLLVLGCGTRGRKSQKHQHKNRTEEHEVSGIYYVNPVFDSAHLYAHLRLCTLTHYMLHAHRRVCVTTMSGCLWVSLSVCLWAVRLCVSVWEQTG